MLKTCGELDLGNVQSDQRVDTDRNQNLEISGHERGYSELY